MTFVNWIDNQNGVVVNQNEEGISDRVFPVDGQYAYPYDIYGNASYTLNDGWTSAHALGDTLAILHNVPATGVVAASEPTASGVVYVYDSSTLALKYVAYGEYNNGYGGVCVTDSYIAVAGYSYVRILNKNTGKTLYRHYHPTYLTVDGSNVKQRDKAFCMNDDYYAIPSSDGFIYPDGGLNVKGEVIIYHVSTGEVAHKVYPTYTNDPAKPSTGFGTIIRCNSTHMAVSAPLTYISGSDNGVLYIYEMATGNLVKTWTPGEYLSYPGDDGLYMDEDYVIIQTMTSAYSYGRVYVFDCNDNFNLVRTINNPYRGSNDITNVCRVGDTVYFGNTYNQYGRVYAYTISTGAYVGAITNSDSNLKYLGTVLASCGTKIIVGQEALHVDRYQVPHDYNGSVRAYTGVTYDTTLYPVNQILSYGDDTGRIMASDANTPYVVATGDSREGANVFNRISKTPHLNLYNETGNVYDGGTYIKNGIAVFCKPATSTAAGIIDLYDVVNNAHMPNFPINLAYATYDYFGENSVVFNDDYIFVGDGYVDDGLVIVISTETGAVVTELRPEVGDNTGFGHTVDISPDGKYLIVGCGWSGFEVRIYDAHALTVYRTIPIPADTGLYLYDSFGMMTSISNTYAVMTMWRYDAGEDLWLTYAGIYNFHTGLPTGGFPDDVYYDPEYQASYPGDNSGMGEYPYDYILKISDDGKRIAHGGNWWPTYVHDVTGKLVQTYYEDFGELWACADDPYCFKVGGYGGGEFTTEGYVFTSAEDSAFVFFASSCSGSVHIPNS